MMQTNRTSWPPFMAALVVLVLSCVLAVSAGASPGGDEDDKMGATVQPIDVTELMGKEITYEKRNDYVTTNRPTDDGGKMFVLYNVGAKKFLNVGSYWGTHAALSNVPRLFWLQRRNEKSVSPSWGYVRYPETPGESEGSFKKSFFALTTMQVGSEERSKQTNGTDKTIAPHALYDVKYIGSDGSETIIYGGGTEASDTEILPTKTVDVNLKTGYIKAVIDMTNCKGNGSSTDGNTYMETLLSLGANIKYWAYNGINQNNVHIFGFKKDGKSYIRVCPVDASYRDATHKSGGNENPINIGDDNLVTVIIGTVKGSRTFTVNERDCMPRVTADHTSPIAPFFALNTLQMGSQEGTVRSNATYDHVSLVTTQSQDLADTCVVKPGAHYTGNSKFYRQYSGNLAQWQVRADLDLSTCTGTSENVLSVGTDIASWASETGYNLHVYYTADKNVIEVDAAKGDDKTSNKYKGYKNTNVPIADPRHVVLLVDQEGVHVNGTLVYATDGNEVLTYLLDQATSLQVGSLQGDSRSHAIYRSLAVTKAKKSFPDPDDNEMWDKRPFMKTLDGNLKQWEIVVEMDLSNCTSGKTDENVLSIGTDIASWSGGDNLHLYYTPTDNLLEIDAVNSSNAKGIKTQRYPANNAKVTVKLNATGLYLDGQLVYGPDNAIVANLLDATTKALQVGSKQGNGSDAKYTGFTFTQQAVEPDPTYPVAGKAWTGAKWDTGEQADFQNIDLSTKQIVVNLDLSTCTGTNENVLSIGNDIAVWGKENAYNLHIYYSKDASTMTVYSEKGENKTSNPYVQVTKTPTVTDNSNVTVTLNQDGLYVGSERIFAPTDKVVEYLLANPGSIQVGSKEGSTRSHATYNKVAVEDYTQIVVFPSAGAMWDGTAFATTVSGNLADNPIEASIDLSTCTGKKENVLSVGTDIQYWGNETGAAADANNVHIYYSKGESMVYLDVVYKSGYTQYQPKVTAGGTLTVKLTSDGLWINGKQIDDSQKKGGTEGALAHVIAHLSQTATTLQVGGKQGNVLSHATYNTLTAGGTSLLGTAQASARALSLADASGSTAKAASTLTVEVTNVPEAQEYVPFDDFKPNGGKFGSETYNVSFEGGDRIEATVDLTNAKNANENIFSVGNGIADWNDTGKTNLHIYYAGTDADGDLTMMAAFVNDTNKDGVKRAFSIPGSSKVMKLTLSKDGLIVNGHDIFASTDTIPAINYDAALAGDIVRFKCDENGNFVKEDGALVEVKPSDPDYEQARGTKVSIATGYIYTDDAHNSGVLPLFISSKFKQESTASNNEDVFFSWAPRLGNSDRKWGNVGVFADRGLPQPEISNAESLNCSQWFFEPAQPEDNTAETGHNLYRIYLKMDNAQYTTRTGSKGNYKMEWATYDGQRTFYLQGTADNVYGNDLGDYFTGSTSNDVTLVEALPDNEGGDLGLWKVIDITEYDRLFGSSKSEMTDMLDLSYLLSDPSFSRENPNLTGWEIEGLATGAGKSEIRVGYDYYSKKALDDKDYTDESGHKDRTSNGSLIEAGSNQYSVVKGVTNNHARYMGFDVRNNASTGGIHQDVTVSNPGWYAVTCSGLTNAGATLYVMKVDGNGGTSAPVTMPLHQITDVERQFFNNPNVGWPFDKVDDTHPMPMYNALVAMNDRNIKGMKIDDKGQLVNDPDLANANVLLADKYTSQVAFFVDSLVLKDNGGEIKLRLGVNVPAAGTAATDGGISTQADATRADEDATIQSTDKWTVVDDFHLLFGGQSQEPNLVLNEDSTSLGYLDRSLHAFDARPMRLYRTFAQGKWNTIILPVNLSKSDFEKLFGTMATDNNADGSQLAQLDHLTKNTIDFVSVKDNDENGVMLKAFKPYIMRVKNENANGNTLGQAAYTAQLWHRANSAERETVGVPKEHYYLDGATLEGKKTDANGQPSYTFEADTKGKQTLEFGTSTAYATGELFTYYDNTLATRNDTEETDGKLNIANLRAYGTMCKNYVTAGTVLEGHPTLHDGYVMNGNNLYKIKNKYGTKGFRCWFASEDTAGQIASNTKVSIDGVVDGTTGIADIYGDTETPVVARFADGVYTIDGRKVRGGTSLDGLPAGVYIVGGRKTVVSR